MPPKLIAVTGAAGKTGLSILNALSASGAHTRAIIHTPRYTETELQAGATEVAVADLLDEASLSASFKGVDRIYLICPNVHPDELAMVKNVISASKAVGVKRIVYHSVLLPEIREMPHHWQKHLAEQELIASALDYTILQPASYMQNILPYMESIRAQGIYRIPYDSKALFSPVDLADVAQVASKVLLEEKHNNKTYALAGPQELSSADMADAVGTRLGRSVSADIEPLEIWRAQALLKGLDTYAIEALSAMFVYYSENGLTGDPSTLPDLLGRPATTFAQYLSLL